MANTLSKEQRRDREGSIENLATGKQNLFQSDKKLASNMFEHSRKPRSEATLIPVRCGTVMPRRMVSRDEPCHAQGSSSSINLKMTKVEAGIKMDDLKNQSHRAPADYVNHTKDVVLRHAKPVPDYVGNMAAVHQSEVEQRCRCHQSRIRKVNKCGFPASKDVTKQGKLSKDLGAVEHHCHHRSRSREITKCDFPTSPKSRSKPEIHLKKPEAAEYHHLDRSCSREVTKSDFHTFSKVGAKPDMLSKEPEDAEHFCCNRSRSRDVTKWDFPTAPKDKPEMHLREPEAAEQHHISRSRPRETTKKNFPTFSLGESKPEVHINDPDAAEHHRCRQSCSREITKCDFPISSKDVSKPDVHLKDPEAPKHYHSRRSRSGTDTKSDFSTDLKGRSKPEMHIKELEAANQHHSRRSGGSREVTKSKFHSSSKSGLKPDLFLMEAGVEKQRHRQRSLLPEVLEKSHPEKQFRRNLSSSSDEWWLSGTDQPQLPVESKYDDICHESALLCQSAKSRITSGCETTKETSWKFVNKANLKEDERSWGCPLKLFSDEDEDPLPTVMEKHHRITVPEVKLNPSYSESLVTSPDSECGEIEFDCMTTKDVPYLEIKKGIYSYKTEDGSPSLGLCSANDCHEVNHGTCGSNMNDVRFHTKEGLSQLENVTSDEIFSNRSELLSQMKHQHGAICSISDCSIHTDLTSGSKIMTRPSEFMSMKSASSSKVMENTSKVKIEENTFDDLISTTTSLSKQKAVVTDSQTSYNIPVVKTKESSRIKPKKNKSSSLVKEITPDCKRSTSCFPATEKKTKKVISYSEPKKSATTKETKSFTSSCKVKEAGQKSTPAKSGSIRRDMSSSEQRQKIAVLKWPVMCAPDHDHDHGNLLGPCDKSTRVDDGTSATDDEARRQERSALSGRVKGTKIPVAMITEAICKLPLPDEILYSAETRAELASGDSKMLAATGSSTTSTSDSENTSVDNEIPKSYSKTTPKPVLTKNTTESNTKEESRKLKIESDKKTAESRKLRPESKKTPKIDNKIESKLDCEQKFAVSTTVKSESKMSTSGLSMATSDSKISDCKRATFDFKQVASEPKRKTANSKMAITKSKLGVDSNTLPRITVKIAPKTPGSKLAKRPEWDFSNVDSKVAVKSTRRPRVLKNDSGASGLHFKEKTTLHGSSEHVR